MDAATVRVRGREREGRHVQEQGKRGRLPLVDALLVAAIVAVICGVLAMVVATPAWWKWCLDRLDVRDWGVGTRSGVGAALLAVLLVIRLRPERKR